MKTKQNLQNSHFWIHWAFTAAVICSTGGLHHKHFAVHNQIFTKAGNITWKLACICHFLRRTNKLRKPYQLGMVIKMLSLNCIHQIGSPLFSWMNWFIMQGTHTHTHSHTHTHTHSHKHTHSHTQTHTPTHTYSHTNTRTHTQTHALTHTNTHTHTHTQTHAITHTLTHTHTHTQTHVLTHTNTRTHTHPHTNTHTHTHTHTLTHTHSHTQFQPSLSAEDKFETQNEWLFLSLSLNIYFIVDLMMAVNEAKTCSKITLCLPSVKKSWYSVLPIAYFLQYSPQRMSKNEHCLQNSLHPEGLHHLNLSYVATGNIKLFLFSHTV